MEILTLQHLTFTYPEAKTPALRDVTLSLHEGEFFVLCGYSGSGKSTLLRQCKPHLAPHGTREGDISFCGAPLEALRDRRAAADIGFVMQSPENQIVTDKVWHELAFGLESLGLDAPSIRRRVAEMASFFGMESWFYQETASLSGGQKQLLNLASVMVMQPKLLLLDEPTAQLDPIAASEFLDTLRKINHELGTTILLADHRLEEALPLASRAAVMENGALLFAGTVPAMGTFLKKEHHGMFLAMPAAARVWGALPSQDPCPVSTGEGRSFLQNYLKNHPARPLSPTPARAKNQEPCLTAKELWFRYEKDTPDVLKGFELTARPGELLCLLGGNGAGKTTALRVLGGAVKAYRGEVTAAGRVARLPQNPQTLFLRKTLREDLAEVLREKKWSPSQIEARIQEVLTVCHLTELEKRHPYDLSGGEQQRAALAKVLLTDPDILLLDEPTKGMDARFKETFAAILRSLQNAGVCLLMVSHDVEFCARYATRCLLLFDGAVVCEEEPRRFFAGNRFYTTGAAHMARGLLPNAVTAEDIIEAAGGTLPEIKSSAPAYTHAEEMASPVDDTAPPRLARWRKWGAGLSAAAALAVMLLSAKNGTMNEMAGPGGITALGTRQLVIDGIFLLFLVITALFLGQKSLPSAAPAPKSSSRRLPKRTVFSLGIILFAIPLTLFLGTRYLGQKHDYLLALALLFECMLPFFLVFEGKRPSARELAVIAALCGLCVAGRAAFFMLPQFKPVMAMTIIAGVALGGETGFLVGAVSMLVSNILFSQGPWTPWQMFAMGLVGFLAGLLYHRDFLRRTRLSLCVFGGVCAFLIYGGIMNFASALLWADSTLSVPLLASYYLAGFPMDCVHAAATVIFLWFLSDPLLEKLERIKKKYHLSE